MSSNMTKRAVVVGDRVSMSGHAAGVRLVGEVTKIVPGRRAVHATVRVTREDGSTYDIKRSVTLLSLE